jgi:hypothetical protein
MKDKLRTEEERIVGLNHIHQERNGRFIIVKSLRKCVDVRFSVVDIT